MEMEAGTRIIMFFDKSINRLELEGIKLYSLKVDVANDLDNLFSDQHEVCFTNNLGHQSDKELGNIEAERATKECYVIHSNKREYYSLSWAHKTGFLENFKK